MVLLKSKIEYRVNIVCALHTHDIILNYWWLYGITSEYIYIIDLLNKMFLILIQKHREATPHTGQSWVWCGAMSSNICQTRLKILIASGQRLRGNAPMVQEVIILHLLLTVFEYSNTWAACYMSVLVRCPLCMTSCRVRWNIE